MGWVYDKPRVFKTTHRDGDLWTTELEHNTWTESVHFETWERAMEHALWLGLLAGVWSM